MSLGAWEQGSSPLPSYGSHLLPAAPVSSYALLPPTPFPAEVWAPPPVGSASGFFNARDGRTVVGTGRVSGATWIPCPISYLPDPESGTVRG